MVEAPGDMMGQKITIIGYGNQGAAWAENFRDAGWNVTLALRFQSPSWKKAEQKKWVPIPISDAIPSSDWIALLIPDDSISSFIQEYGNLFHPGQTLIFAHGYALHYKTAAWPDGVSRILVAPKGIGTAVREQFVKGSGVPAVLAIDHDTQGKGWTLAANIAHGLGSTRVGIYKSTVKEEVEADLFSEQAILCGGLPALIAETYDTMVKSGMSPEVAYLECVHELTFITNLFQKQGIQKTLEFASPTARFGGLQSAHRLISPSVKQELKKLLEEIQSGDFRVKLENEAKGGFQTTKAEMKALGKSTLEQVGSKVRNRIRNL